MDDETVNRVAQGIEGALRVQPGVTIEGNDAVIALPLNIHRLALSLAVGLFVDHDALPAIGAEAAKLH